MRQGMARFMMRRKNTGGYLPHVILVLMSLALSSSLWSQAGSSVDRPTSDSSTRAEKTSKDANTSAAAGPHDDSFIIGADDVLAINVWKEPEVSRSVPVRSDGKISLPLAGEVQAAGETPRQLELEIAKRLQSYMSEPEVTVIVQQINSQKFNILGQVLKPGSYPLANSPTVLDAIALAGGFRDFAKKKSIYVLRQSPGGGQVRLPFNYKDMVKGKNSDQNVKLQPRDTIVVP
jgi:polysaccharide export outer membrane protein